jgi:hypothetical protein
MKTEQVLLEIQALENIQSAARNLTSKLHDKEARWQKIYDRIKNTPEWKAHCRATGSCEHYTFHDALA